MERCAKHVGDRSVRSLTGTTLVLSPHPQGKPLGVLPATCLVVVPATRRALLSSWTSRLRPAKQSNSDTKRPEVRSASLQQILAFFCSSTPSDELEIEAPWAGTYTIRARQVVTRRRTVLDGPLSKPLGVYGLIHLWDTCWSDCYVLQRSSFCTRPTCTCATSLICRTRCSPSASLSCLSQF